MADANTSTSPIKTAITIFFVIIVAALAIWAIIVLSPEKPETKPEPKPTPCTCEVKPETPAELPKTGVDL